MQLKLKSFKNILIIASLFILLVDGLCVFGNIDESFKMRLIDEEGKRPTLVQDYFSKETYATPIMLEARIDVPMELTLERALDIAIENNLKLLDTRLSSESSKWKWKENLFSYLPDYSVGFDWRRLDGRFLIGGVFPVDSLTSNYNAYMRLDWKFLDSGRKIFNTLASKKLFRASKEAVSLITNGTLLKVVKAYNSLLHEQARLDVYAKSLEEAKADLTLNENLEKQGVGTKFNILQSKTQLAEQEHLFISQQAKFRQSSITLANILNLDQATHITPDLSELKPKSLFDINQPIQEILTVAFMNRPEIKKAELEYYAQKNLVGLSVSDFLPTANFYGQYGGTGAALFNRTNETTITPDAIALDATGDPVVSRVDASNVIRGGGVPFGARVDDSLMSNKSLGVEFRWLLGRGLGVSTAYKIKQAKNQVKIKKNALDQVKQDVENEVRKTYLNVQTSERLLELAKSRVESSSEALRLSRLRLENGIGINTEVLNSETSYRDALSARVSAIVDYNNSQAELLHSLGIISVEKLISG